MFGYHGNRRDSECSAAVKDYDRVTANDEGTLELKF